MLLILLYRALITESFSDRNALFVIVSVEDGKSKLLGNLSGIQV